MAKYVPLESFCTPVGVTHFPNVNTPDTFMNKTQYKCDLLFDNESDEWLAFSEPIQEAAERELDKAVAVYEAELAKAKTPAMKKKVERNEPYLNLPWSDHTDKDGELTGQQKLKITCGEGHKPSIFVDGQQGPQDVEIRGGMTLKVLGKMVPYSMEGRTGIALSRMGGVKVYNGAGGGSGAMDFGEGVESSAVTEQAPAESDGEEGDAANGGDF